MVRGQATFFFLFFDVTENHKCCSMPASFFKFSTRSKIYAMLCFKNFCHLDLSKEVIKSQFNQFFRCYLCTSG